MKPAGQPHQTLRFPVPFRPGHTEIVGDPRVGIRAFFGANDDTGIAAETAQPADDGGVLGVKAITGEGCEIIDQPLDIGNAVRPVGMAGDLHLLPRRQAGIGLLQQPVGLALKLAHLVGDIDLACIREMAKLFDFAFQLRDRPFEIKKGLHAVNRPIPFAGAFLT